MSIKAFSCFNEGGFDDGGIESYYIRLYRWAKSNRFELFFFMPEGRKINDKWTDSFRKMNISVVCYKKMGKRIRFEGGKMEGFDDISEESLCITSSFETFTAANKIFRNKNKKMKIFFYVFHPYVTGLCKKRLMNKLWAEPVLLDIKCSNLIFMDEETRDYANRYYQKIDFSNAEIIRLGMEIPPFNLEERRNAYKKQNFTILTMARFEFPFKGYIKGLIDVYIHLKKKYKNLELIIIGDGKARTELEVKIRSVLDNNIAADIHMVGYIPYDEIWKYIGHANVFVGMGTTILDSAKYGVPGIVATAYQTEDYAVGFFSSDYTCIGKLINEDGAKKYHFGDLIEEVYSMSENDYLKECKECYDLLEKHYGIENCMAQIMGMDGTGKVKIPFGIYFFYNYMLPLWRKFKKI